MKRVFEWLDTFPDIVASCVLGFGGLAAVIAFCWFCIALLGKGAILLWLFLLVGALFSGAVYDAKKKMEKDFPDNAESDG